MGIWNLSVTLLNPRRLTQYNRSSWGARCFRPEGASAANRCIIWQGNVEKDFLGVRVRSAASPERRHSYSSSLAHLWKKKRLRICLWSLSVTLHLVTDSMVRLAALMLMSGHFNACTCLSHTFFHLYTCFVYRGLLRCPNATGAWAAAGGASRRPFLSNSFSVNQPDGPFTICLWNWTFCAASLRMNDFSVSPLKEPRRQSQTTRSFCGVFFFYFPVNTNLYVFKRGAAGIYFCKIFKIKNSAKHCWIDKSTTTTFLYILFLFIYFFALHFLFLLSHPPLLLLGSKSMKYLSGHRV